MQDEDIDLCDILEVTEEQIKQAVLRVSGKPVERGHVFAGNRVITSTIFPELELTAEQILKA